MNRQLIDRIEAELNERMTSQVNSLCATGDEVYLAALLSEIHRLREIIDEVHSWAVCGAITTAEDIIKNMPRIVEITAPDYEACSAPNMEPTTKPVRRCRVCGCTDLDCSQCIKRTGSPCYWVEKDLCSACVKGE